MKKRKNRNDYSENEETLFPSYAVYCEDDEEEEWELRVNFIQKLIERAEME